MSSSLCFLLSCFLMIFSALRWPRMRGRAYFDRRAGIPWSVLPLQVLIPPFESLLGFDILQRYIDSEKAFCLNEEESGTVRKIFKSYDRKTDKLEVSLRWNIFHTNFSAHTFPVCPVRLRRATHHLYPVCFSFCFLAFLSSNKFHVDSHAMWRSPAFASAAIAKVLRQRKWKRLLLLPILILANHPISFQMEESLGYQLWQRRYSEATPAVDTPTWLGGRSQLPSQVCYVFVLPIIYALPTSSFLSELWSGKIVALYFYTFLKTLVRNKQQFHTSESRDHFRTYVLKMIFVIFFEILLVKKRTRCSNVRSQAATQRSPSSWRELFIAEYLLKTFPCPQHP